MIPLPIETERLTIRPFAEGDLARVTAIFTDPVVMEYISLHGKTVPELIDVYRARYDERGYSFWALTEKNGAIVGDVGFGTYAPTGDPEVG